MKDNTKPMIPASAIREAGDDHNRLISSYLRQHGWEYTSSNPGSMWLWTKTLDDGRVVLCPEGTAFMIQEELTPDPEEDNDHLDY